MSGGVKGPSGPGYTHNPPPADEKPSSPVLSPEPQIPRSRGKAPKSILKNRTVQQTTTAMPRVNQKAREKMERVNQGQNLVAQLEQLLTQQQFMAYKNDILEAIANPEMLPEDFTIVYIDENGQEVTVIPPEPELHNDHEQEALLRNSLKAQVYKLDEHFNEDVSEKIDEAVLTTIEQLEECNQQLAALQTEPFSKPKTPQRVCLDTEYLTAPPGKIPLPLEDMFVLDENPVTRNSSKNVSFDEDKFSEDWVEFYTSPDEIIPGQFYSLADIRRFSDDDLEKTHDFIQLLFPNKHISEHNPGAPLLTEDLAKTIHDTPALRDEALKSVDQMLKFWGLERSGNNITVNSNEAARHSKWDGAFDHNHKRITRMLDFLMECGQFRLASNIEQAMQHQRTAKQQTEKQYWAKAVGRDLDNH